MRCATISYYLDRAHKFLEWEDLDPFSSFYKQLFRDLSYIPFVWLGHEVNRPITCAASLICEECNLEQSINKTVPN